MASEAVVEGAVETITEKQRALPFPCVRWPSEAVETRENRRPRRAIVQKMRALAPRNGRAKQSDAIIASGTLPLLRRVYELKRKPRPVLVWEGTATLDEPVGPCPTCRRDSFPQRVVLKLDGNFSHLPDNGRRETITDLLGNGFRSCSLATMTTLPCFTHQPFLLDSAVWLMPTYQANHGRSGSSNALTSLSDDSSCASCRAAMVPVEV